MTSSSNVSNTSNLSWNRCINIRWSISHIFIRTSYGQDSPSICDLLTIRVFRKLATLPTKTIHMGKSKISSAKEIADSGGRIQERLICILMPWWLCEVNNWLSVWIFESFIKSCSTDSRNDPSPKRELVHKTKFSSVHTCLLGTVSKALECWSRGPVFYPHCRQFFLAELNFLFHRGILCWQHSQLCII